MASSGGSRPEAATKHKLDNDNVLGEGACKKGRQCNIFTEFPEKFKRQLDEELVYFIDADFFERHLTSYWHTKMPCVTALKLMNCNATDEGASFSKAYCKVERCIPTRPLALLFTHGINVLMKYIKKGIIPENRQHRSLLSKLLQFIVDNMDSMKGKDRENPLVNLEDFGDETEQTVILANHLFGKLSMSEEFVIDSHRKWKREQKYPCPVLSCTLTGRFGDTSVGNKDVWHGNLDIIINDLAVMQSPADDLDNDNSDDENSPGGKSSVEVKSKSGSTQITAEVIVFSFLQKKMWPESDHFLVPCVGINDTYIVVYFYDSEHDVLLESCRFDLLHRAKLNLTAVIVAWLVVNYKYTCSGLESDMMRCKSGFFSLAKDKLEIYENSLKLGHVGKASHQVQFISALPRDLHLLKERFKYD